MTTDLCQGNANLSVVDPSSRSRTEVVSELCAAVTICTVTIFGNTLIVIAIKKIESVDRTTNSFIANLAYTDLAMALIIMPLWMTVIACDGWILGHSACYFFGYAKFVFVNASLNTLTLIAINRYLKVVKTELHRKLFRSKKVVIALQLLSWIIPAVIYSPPLFGWATMKFYPKTALCTIEISARNTPYILFTLLSQPSPYIVCFCYVKICGRVKDNRVQVCSLRNRAACLRAQEAESKILKTTFAIVCVFVVCLTPSVISAILYAADVSVPRPVHRTFTFLLFANAALNCVVYGYMNPQMKAAIIKTLNCCRRSEYEEENTSANTEC